MHSIRLRGPWQFVIVSDSDPSLPSTTGKTTGKIKLPGDWAQPISSQQGTDDPETVRIGLIRSFNAPTGIESSRVNVELSNLGPPTELETSLTINGQQVEPAVENESQRFDITPCLAQHNQLAIQVTLNPTRKYFGEVTIQILDL